MSTLFVLSHAPASDPGESRKLSFARDGDAVLLIEDAVFGAGDVQTPLTAALEDATNRGLDVFALEPDLTARGIETSLKTVDYAGFVELLTKHDRAVH